MISAARAAGAAGAAAARWSHHASMSRPLVPGMSRGAELSVHAHAPRENGAEREMQMRDGCRVCDLETV